MNKGFGMTRRILALSTGLLAVVAAVQVHAARGVEKGHGSVEKGKGVGEAVKVELSKAHVDAIDGFEKSIGKLGKGTSEKVKAALTGDAATSAVVLGVLTNNPIKNKELSRNYLDYVATKAEKGNEEAAQTTDKVFELSKNLNGWDAKGIENLQLFQTAILKNLDAGMTKEQALKAARAEMEKLGLKDLSEQAKLLEKCT